MLIIEWGGKKSGMGILLKYPRFLHLVFPIRKNLGKSSSCSFSQFLHPYCHWLIHALRAMFFLTQTPLFYLWGKLLKRVRKQPYIIVLIDMYPEVAAAAGILIADSYLYRILRRSVVFGLKNADSVIVIGRDMKEKVTAAGIPNERVHIIPNWVTLGIFHSNLLTRLFYDSSFAGPIHESIYLIRGKPKDITHLSGGEMILSLCNY